MPQLLPLPWFATLLFAWFVFLSFLPKKIMGHTSPYEPMSLKPQKLEKAPWNWPWA